MSRKILFAFVVFAAMFMTVGGALRAQGLDSLKKLELAGKLQEYFEALKHENIETQKAECDFLIETATDPQVRNFIAQTIYDHYMDSKIMGAEAVAIHMADNWFIPGKVTFDDESELFAAKIFAEFNRLSQIGAKAPELSMESLDGKYFTLFEAGEAGQRFRVLYFYDTDCSRCRMETILLRNILETEDFPVEVYAIYVGDDRTEWQDYVADRLSQGGGKAVLTHLWDPAMDSDYQRKYGVLQTPRLFLVAPDGTIVGRGLDAQTLAQMLHGIFDPVELEYGGKESETLFDGIFGSEDSPSADEVTGISDYIATTTLAKGDTVMFRQLTGDLLYYLAGRSGEGFKEGMKNLIDNHILNGLNIWRTQDDSLKIVGFARVMDDLLSKAEPGSAIVDVKVPGELRTWKRTKPVEVSLRKLKGNRNIIIFYTEGCNICDAEKAAADFLLSAGRSKDKSVAGPARRTRVLMVNIDRIMAEDPDLAARLFDSFDLTALPFIIMTDKNGTVMRRYLSLQ